MKQIKQMVAAVIAAVCLCLVLEVSASANGLGSFNAGTYYTPEEDTVEENKTRSNFMEPKLLQSSSDFTEKIKSTYKVKDQGDYSTCWAFSLASTAEINLMKKGLTKEFVDLSESHLAYFFFHRVSDQWGRTKGDTVKYVGDGNYLMLGNDSNFAMTALANWVGFADEKDGEYSKVEQNTATYGKLSNSAKITMQSKDRAHLINTEIVNPKNRDLIKSKLKSYGAASTGFCWDSTYYNKKNYSYNCNLGYIANHAVTIVGYDDKYSKNNFSTKPEKDGAWLVLNSWSSDWGDEGYFWISYYDKSLGNFEFLDVALDNNYDTAYQYDGSSGMKYDFARSKSGCANVFTTSNSSESLNAVSFYTLQDNVKYDINIYSGFKSKDNKGTLLKKLSGTSTSAGYHTIKLPQAIMLDPNTKFAVEVTYQAGYYYVAIPWDASYTVNAGDGQGIKFVATSSKGQSYSINRDGKWSDSPNNYRVKAFTTDTIKHATNNEKTVIELYWNNKKVKTLSKTKNNSLYLVPKYSVKGYTFNGWYKEPEFKNKVSTVSLKDDVIKLYAKETINVGKTSALKAANYSKSTIQLKWNKAENAKQYEVYQYNEKSKSYKYNTTVNGNSVDIKKLSANKIYRFKVRGINGKVKGAFSNVISTSTKLNTPSLKTSYKNNVKTIKIAKNTTATYMEVYIKTGNGSYKLNKTVKVKSGKVSKITIKSSRRKTYYVKVRTYTVQNDKKYYSNYSSQAKTTKTDKIILCS